MDGLPLSAPQNTRHLKKLGAIWLASMG